MNSDNPATLDDPAFFVHRPWIDSQLESWLTSDTESPVAIMTGPPGTGKSRYAYWFSKQLPNFQPKGRVPALGAAILKDRWMGRPRDQFSWPALRTMLLALTGNITFPPRVPKKIKMRIRDIGPGSVVIGNNNNPGKPERGRSTPRVRHTCAGAATARAAHRFDYRRPG